MEKGRFKIALILLSLITLTFILLPIVKLITTPSVKDIINVLKDPKSLNAIFNSIVFSLISSLVGLLIGIPLSYLMAKGYFGKFEKVIEALSDIPLATPHTVAGIALLLVFGRDGLIGRLLYKSFNIRLLGTGFAVVVAMLFVSIPFIINNIREGFKSINPSLEKASYNLGATFIHTFFFIDIPLVKSHILSGFFSSWARAISEFGAVIIIAYYPMTAPIKIYDAYTQYNLQTSIAIAASLLIISLILFAILKIVSGR